MTEEQRLFFDDAQEIVERLYRDLEQLRVARNEGRRRRELAAQIFRRVHTLKGSGASLGFKSVSEIAHQFEGVLDGARLGRIELIDPVLDTFEDALDCIAETLQGPPSETLDAKFQPIIARLKALAEQSKKQATIESGLRTALPEDIARGLSDYDVQHAREAIREGAKLFIVSAGFPIDTFDHGFRELSKLLGQSGEVIATIPGEASNADEINFRLLYAAELLSRELLRQASLVGRIEHQELPIQNAAGQPVQSHQKPSTAASSTSDGATPVRVELKQLDDLISSASELFRQSTNALVTFAGSSRTDVVDRTIRNLRGRFVEMEERLIKLRLVPIGEVLERAASRAGRIAARQLGKEVEFEIVGGEVGIEALIPVGIGAKARRHIVRHHFKDAANGVAGLQGTVYLGLHALFSLFVNAIQQNLFALVEGLKALPGDLRHGQAGAAHSHDVAQDFDSQVAQKKFCQSAHGNTRGRFARRGPLENVTRLGKVVFKGPGQVGVPGPRRLYLFVFLGIACGHRQRLLPVLPVLVSQSESDGRADGLAVAYAGENVGGVALDAHASATSVALLTAP